MSILLANPAWNYDRGSCYLLDLLCQRTFFDENLRKLVKLAFGREYQRVFDAQAEAAPSIMSWVTMSAEQGVTLITSQTSEFSWLAFNILEVEEEFEATQLYWKALKEAFKHGDNDMTLDKAMKVAGQNLPEFAGAKKGVGVAYLGVYSWSQQLLKCPSKHPLLPILAQKFLLFYFDKPVPDKL